MEKVKIIRTLDGFGNSELSDALNYNYISNIANVGAEGLTLNTKSYNKIKEEYSNKFVVSTFERSNFIKTEILEKDDCIIFVLLTKNNDTATVNIYAKDNKTLETWFDIFKKGNFSDSVYVKIKNIFASSNGSMDDSESNKFVKDFDHLDNDYYPFINVDEMFEQFLLSDSNILFLYGEPGTGKTKLADSYIKFLINKAENKDTPKEILDRFVFNDELDTFVSVVTVKNEDLLAKDVFWNELINNSHSLVFLDDLDYLLPRTTNLNSGKDVQNNKFISQFLSFTEGINKNNDKTKFIITTNRNAKEIDEALLRKGRCFDILNLRPLKNKEALNLWKKNGLNVKTFNSLFKDDKILQSDLADEIKKQINQKKYGYKFKNYLKEEGISHIHNINVKKNVGFKPTSKKVGFSG